VPVGAASFAELGPCRVEELLRVSAIDRTVPGADTAVQVVDEADHDPDLAAQVPDVAGGRVGVAERVPRIEGDERAGLEGLRRVGQRVVGGQASLRREGVLAGLTMLDACGVLAKRRLLVACEGARRGRRADQEHGDESDATEGEGVPVHGDAKLPGTSGVAKVSGRIFR
jgi:hypothetical protein